MPTDNRSIDGGRSPIGMTLLAMVMAFSVVSPVKEDESEKSSQQETEPLKLTDLSLRPLLHICRFLRSGQNNTALDAFRKTSRAFAATVNSFLELPKNLPQIKHIRIRDTGLQLFLSVSMPVVDYWLHPICNLGGQIDQGEDEISKTIEDDQSIDHAATVLLGPVHQLYIDCSNLVIDLGKIRRVVRNLRIEWVLITCTALGDALASDILDLVRELFVSKITINFETCQLSDSLAFIAAIDEAVPYSKMFALRNSRSSSGPPFLGQSADFWRAFLKKKVEDGLQVTCDDHGVIGLPDHPIVLTPSPYRIWWTRLD